MGKTSSTLTIFQWLIVIFVPFLFFYSSCLKAINVKSLTDIKNEHGVHIQMIYPSSTIKLDRYPFDSNEEEILIVNSPRTFVAVLPFAKVFRGKLNNKNLSFVTYDDHIVKESIWTWSPIRKIKESISLNIVAKKIPGRVLVLAQEGDKNYYHWLLEALPKLALIEKSGIKFDYIYAPVTWPPFIKETIGLLGINKPFIDSDLFSNRYVEAESIVLPSFVGISTYTPTWVVDYLRDKLLLYQTTPETAHKYIYISRKNAEHRKVNNENYIISELKRIGFIDVYLEDMTVQEQIGIISNADVILAPHGAGLANIVFAKSGAKVIELVQNHYDASFWHLSKSLDIKYHLIETNKVRIHNEKSAYENTVIDWMRVRDEIFKVAPELIKSVQEQTEK